MEAMLDSTGKLIFSAKPAGFGQFQGFIPPLP
jgi:hypothetical protein